MATRCWRCAISTRHTSLRPKLPPLTPPAWTRSRRAPFSSEAPPLWRLTASFWPEAEKLVCTALTGNPPEDIAEELRDLLEQIYFERHLALRGIQLQADEIQMSIAGKAVGFGIAPTEAFLRRVENAENLLYRTAERQQGKPYRDRGRRDKSLSENLQLFMTVPRAASFAVTFRVGASQQLSLPGLSPGEKVIDELVE